MTEVTVMEATVLYTVHRDLRVATVQCIVAGKRVFMTVQTCGDKSSNNGS